MKRILTMEDEIAAMKAAIDKEKNYCEENVYPHVKRIADKSIQRNPFPFWMIVHRHEGIWMTIDKYKVGHSRKKNRWRLQVNIWYKFRKVLGYQLGLENNYSKLNVFHACEWLDKFEEFCSYVDEKFAKEDLKIGEERAKRRMKRLKSRCAKYENYCKKDE